MLGRRFCNASPLPMPPSLSSHLADDLAPREAATPLRWPPLPAFVPALLVFAGYYGGACLGLALTTVMSPASVLWVPGAVLFGALLVASPQRWGPFIAAAIAAHFAAAWQSGVPEAIIIGCLVSNLAQGVVGSLVVRRLVAGQPFSIGSLRCVVALIAGAVVAAVVSSLLNSAFVTAVEWKSAGQTWAGWPARMFANTLASLTVVPLLAAWSAERAPWRSWDMPRRLEAALLALVLAGLAYGVVDPSALPQVPPTLLYLPFPLLLWSAMRLGPAPTTASLAFVSLLAVWGAAHGLRPFAQGTAAQGPLTLHLFLACTALSVLILGAVFAERQEAMLDLGRSQRRFARAFHANPSAVSMIASDGRVIDVNERWCRLFGHPPERALGATIESLGLDVDPADAASIRSRLGGAAVEEHREMRVRDATGRIRDVVMAMTPTRIDGELCSIVSFVDIGDRVEAEKALRASDQRFRFVLEATRDVVYDRDLATGSTWVSRNGLAQFGYAPGVSDGVDLRPLVHADDWARVTTRFTAAVRAGSATCETDYRLRRADGSYAHVHEQAFVVSDGDGRARRVIGVVTDITEQHQREELARRLSQASRLTAMGELAASIAHEINQPVSAILSNVDAAEMLLQEPAPPLDELRDVLADIRSDDLRVTDIIRHVRALATKRVMHFEVFDVNTLIGSVLRLAMPVAQRRGVRVETALAALPPVHGDRIHIQQVVLNLLLNALDALDEVPETERRLRIATTHDGLDRVEIVVADSGRGVDPSRREAIFESFHTTKKEGMGLGLSIARSVVLHHGGSIRVEDNADGGALFRVTLRVRPDESR